MEAKYLSFFALEFWSWPLLEASWVLGPERPDMYQQTTLDFD